MTESMLLRENMDGIAMLTLNRPASRNSLCLALMNEIVESLEAVANDSAIRTVIIAANGPAFCSGHDLKELTAHRSDADGGRDFYSKTWKTCGQMMQAIVRLPQPVIACVQGTATAAGCQLVASCDLAIASTGVNFATPGVNIGLFCSTPMVALSRNVARKQALEMLFIGDAVPAEQALRIGLVNRVVSAGEERNESIRMARQIALKSPAAVRVGKRAFYDQLQMGLEEAYEYTSRIMIENMMSEDAAEGITAFIEKRKPVWKTDVKSNYSSP
jgi:enoyl-CoA hydratase/carnithine racemase